MRHLVANLCFNANFVYPAVGPEVIRSSEAEDILGLSSEIIHKARARRGLSMEDENETQTRLQ